MPIAPINRTDTIVRVGCTRTLHFYGHYNQSKFIKVAFIVAITCFLSVSKSGWVLAGCHPESWVPLGEVLPFSFFLYNLHLHGILGSHALFSRALSSVSDICGSFFPSYSHQRELYFIVIRPSVMARWYGLLAEPLARNSSPIVMYMCQSHLTTQAFPEIPFYLTVTEIKVRSIGLNEQHKGVDCWTP